MLSSLLLLLGATQDPAAGLKLPNLFNDHMVLQRDRSVPIFGQASPRALVSIQIADQNVVVRADENGRFKGNLRPRPAGGPFDLRIISGLDSLVLRNVLFGDVWLCAGQSNMEIPVIEAENAALMRAATRENIRLFKIRQAVSDVPLDDVPQTWSQADPESIGLFSSIGFTFALEVQQNTGVPIGMIQSAIGATKLIAWMRTSAIQRNPLYAPLANLSGQDPVRLPSKVYNAMVNPVTQLPIRGVIFFQGESDVNQAKTYRGLFPIFIQDWRAAWNRPDLPFYYVQLQNYGARQTQPEESRRAELREAQLSGLTLPNTGMAVTIDLGEADNIHPRFRREFGRRLARLALQGTYGFATPTASPLYQSYQVEGNQIRIRFRNVSDGLITNDGRRLEGFAIAGNDRQFVWADARIEGNTVVVQSRAVDRPVAVRYAWADNPIGNLAGGDLLPASPFRTDNWEGLVELEEVNPDGKAPNGTGGLK